MAYYNTKFYEITTRTRDVVEYEKNINILTDLTNEYYELTDYTFEKSGMTRPMH